MTRDFAAATRFYADVFGYTYTEIGDGFEYRTVEVDGHTVGGIGVLPDAVPPTCRRTGGCTSRWPTPTTRWRAPSSSAPPCCARPQDMPYGRHADIADPQGADAQRHHAGGRVPPVPRRRP